MFPRDTSHTQRSGEHFQHFSAHFKVLMLWLLGWSIKAKIVTYSDIPVFLYPYKGVPFSPNPLCCLTPYSSFVLYPFSLPYRLTQLGGWWWGSWGLALPLQCLCREMLHVLTICLYQFSLPLRWTLFTSALEKREFPPHQWIVMKTQSEGSNLLTNIFPVEELWFYSHPC